MLLIILGYTLLNYQKRYFFLKFQDKSMCKRFHVYALFSRISRVSDLFVDYKVSDSITMRVVCLYAQYNVFEYLSQRAVVKLDVRRLAVV